ncbi:MAG TPA: extracellular solute-binding protein [Verrucomicrobiae bacterium]|jgi:iron(III) transport system substrate-binding protein|nr:extracellular solute-binding protein [Verrucomicrobiae bacterium]
MRRHILFLKISTTLALAGLLAACHRSGNSNATPEKPKVVLYCATDREMAQELIDEFEKETGIEIEAKFDTEAAKAVGLVQAIRQEKSNPQCDVFWGGGEFFCAIMANEGCLAPAPEDLVRAVGDAPHDAQGRWLGFAAGYRVLIVNTNVLTPDAFPHSYRDLTDPRFKGHTGIANPLFGGMAAHTAAIFSKIGDDRGRQWIEGLKSNDCAVCAGMADVKNRVASGELWFGITATDDAYVALEGGKPVAVVYPDQGTNEIGCLRAASTAAIVAGAPHPKEAEKLLRFLVNSKTEKVLSAGPAQSVGLLPQSVAEDVRPRWIPKRVHWMDVDWNAAVKAHEQAAKAIKENLLDQ